MKASVPLFRNMLKSVTVETAATVGAQIGVNLLMPDGSVGKVADLQKLFGATATAGSTIRNTDDLEEGQFNFYFTNRRAQDAVGAILANSANVTLAYVGGTSITANLTPITFGGSGSLYAFTFDTYGRVVDYRTPATTDLAEGTNLYFTAARVLATILAGLSTATNAVITAADSVLSALGKLQAQITGNAAIPAGYIDGAKMVWNSATSISLTSGAMFIQSLNAAVSFPSTLTLSALSLTASTWYHLYGYVNSGTPAILLSTTAPGSPYSGTARSMTGDTSKRYLGSVRTDGLGNIYNFVHQMGTIRYNGDVSGASFNILAAGTATTPATVSAASIVPPISKMALADILNNDAAQTLTINNSQSGFTLTASNYTMYVGVKMNITTILPLDSSQAFQYMYSGATSAGAYVRIDGYFYDR